VSDKPGTVVADPMSTTHPLVARLREIADHDPVSCYDVAEVACDLSALLDELGRDRERLDWLESQTGDQHLGWICRDSTTGRGWRLHECQSQWDGRAQPNVRAAISLAMQSRDAGNGEKE